MRAAYIALLLACAPGAAAAQSWTLTATGSGSQVDGENEPFVSGGSVSLERSFEKTWIGGAIGMSQGETSVPEVDASIDQDSLDASLWWGVELGAFDLTLGLNYARQDLDGGFTLLSTDIEIDGETTSTGVGATLARTFGEGATFTPSISLGYSETETNLTWVGASTLEISESTNGFSGAIRLDASVPLSEGVSLLGGGAFIATEDASAQTFAGAGDRAWSRQREDGGAADWGEAHIGLELELSAASTLSGSIGSTIGRDEEEAFGAVSLSWDF